MGGRNLSMGGMGSMGSNDFPPLPPKKGHFLHMLKFYYLVYKLCVCIVAYMYQNIHVQVYHPFSDDYVINNFALLTSCHCACKVTYHLYTIVRFANINCID